MKVSASCRKASCPEWHLYFFAFQEEQMKHASLRNMILSALCLALAYVLPFMTGQIPQIGNMLSPMHIPVLLCGFICGPFWGLAVGLIAPLLRSLTLSMPPLFPTAVCMTFELAAYGLMAGLLYRALPKKIWSVYAALIISMIVGRLVWGLAMLIALGLSGGAFTFEAFLSGAVLKAIPGIILHIVLIPIIVIALEKAGFLKNKA